MRKGRANLAHRVYHVTAATKRREPFFADPRSARAACRCFDNPALLCDAQMLAWVLMPDHAHWLVQIGETKRLQKVIESLKSFSALAANRVSGHRGPVWDRAFHDRALRNEREIPDVARYIVANPLRAGLVERVGDYPYWNTAFL